MIFSILAMLAATASPLPAALPTPQSLASIALRAPKATLHVQVARTEAERERGLMSVTGLRPHTGMLFVFDSDAPVTFWMKDTLIPLDMVFVGADGKVRMVFTNVHIVPPQMPDNDIPRETGQAKYVIELAANEAVRDGLVEGASVGNLPK